MKKVTAEQASRYRQEISHLIVKLKRLCLKAGHRDLLFKGTPIEVYRKCGKTQCRCAAGGESRHGPYQVIQIWDEGKQGQVSLKRSEGKYFEMAKHYQSQRQNRQKIIEIQREILERLEQMIETRCIWHKE